MKITTVKNVLVALLVLAIATMTACNLAAPAQEGSTVEVVLDGIGGAKGNPGGIAGDTNVAWVRINVKLKSTGATTGSGDLTKDIHNVWHGKITVSDVGGLMTFEATAGNQDGTTGVYHVSWSGSAEKNVTGSGLSLTIPVTAGDNTRHIFYVNANSASDGWRYLEVAPIDQSTGIAWSNITGTAIGATAQGTAIGTGKANTTAIVGQSGCTAGAAKLCKAYTGSGYSDWFLPSKDELNAMYLKRATIGSFASAFYCSSSEDISTKMLIQYFSDGTQYSFNKSSSNRVRAVRAF